MLKILGAQIAELRWLKGLSRSQLSALAGVDEEQLAAIECGEMDPDLISICQICDWLEIDVAAFFLLVELRVAGQEPLPLQLDLERVPARPNTLEQYRSCSLWYQQKKLQFDWITKKHRRQIQTYRHCRERSMAMRAQAANISDPHN